MLTQMREATRGYIAWLILIPLVAAFAAWGVEDAFVGTPSTALAEVGGTKIEATEFEREMRTVIKRIEQRTGKQVSTRQAQTLGLPREAMNAMLDRIALTQKAQAIGLVAPRSAAMDVLRGIPGLTDTDGNIMPDRLAQLLRENDLNESALMKQISEDLLRETLVNSLVTGLRPPAGLTAALDKHRLERRVISYLQIEPSRAGVIKDPSDAVLKTYFEKNGERFREPERRSLTYIAISIKGLAAKIDVPEADIAKLYEARKSVYLVPEKRTLEQIRFKTEADAIAGFERLQKGEDFMAIAQVNGMKVDDVKIGSVSQGDKTIPPDTFSVELLKPTQPFRGPFGWVVVRATAITPGTTQRLDEVRSELKDLLANDKARTQMTELTNKLEDALAEQLEFEDAAKKAGLGDPVKIVALDAKGKGAQGETIDGLPTDPDFLPLVFSADTGRVSGLNRDPDGGYYVFRVDRVAPPMLPKLETIKDKVLAQWREEELGTALRKYTQGLADRGKAGTTLKALGDELGLAPLQSPPMPRGIDTELFSQTFVESVFEAKQGEFVTGQVRVGKSYLLAQVDSVTAGSDPAGSDVKARFANSVRQSLASDVADIFTGAAKRQANTAVNEERFKAYVDRN